MESTTTAQIMDAVRSALAHLSALTPTLTLLNNGGETLAESHLLAAFEDGEHEFAPVDDAPPLPISEIFARTMGTMMAKKEPLTQHQICDCAARFVRRHPHWPPIPATEIIRSVTLPVYCRLIRDGHSEAIALPQTLLHILAWKSKEGWVQDQAQRLLWKGGVLGEEGNREFKILDDNLAARGFSFAGLEEILFITALLACLPKGQLFMN
ncbi:hypothetical protein C3432_26765 [Citrobacter amalonaticus]|uniref:2-(5''-triphosphoribosyl)-3'-dephosphocoenzyme-A synthase n=1 Tax=Citrobacter amalonaticus TaxID=35703 RepID=A0A2S4RR05_CITAM|nr:hypothetical protein [Citrobacter amalonaticus]POT54610.1 hypothetical protein C3432_26765 [Citrobacter amalonaticus]POT69556.1 hypothetical protein C3436_26370 [Citrobacter amalonaticus]POU60367.1 hypothetical protein C3430_25290 [Citrobacter amalonaticus]POV02662.1 hypothetical protein C3424_25470 [Citrobacter amalonaticus]